MKRGASGLSLVVGVDKPAGMSSHDVVNRCRALFGEKRVGHAGTLDPLASGVLPVCIGPATRLAAFLTEHDKHYRVSIAFGAATDTDDAAGTVTRTGVVPAKALDRRFAEEFVAGLVGKHRQMPPVYSAIKVGGVKACDAARKGRIIDLAPRDIEVYDARFEGVQVAEAPSDAVDATVQAVWDVSFHVSKGTYIRSLARDIGLKVDCPTHVAQLRRMAAGGITLDDCVSLEALERLGEGAAIDPVRKLGHRFFYGADGIAERISHGSPVRAGDVQLFDYLRRSASEQLCACTSGVRESCAPPSDGELFSVVSDNKLQAIYAYDEGRGAYLPECVFQIGVSRGCDIHR